MHPVLPNPNLFRRFAGILLSVLLQLPVPVCVLPAVCVSPLLQILSQQLFHFLSLL